MGILVCGKSYSRDNPTSEIVTGGERTDEEMCGVFIQAAPAAVDDGS